MTDFTHYSRHELTALLALLFKDTTQPIYSPDDENKIIGEPVYFNGIGLDTESTTIKHQADDNSWIVDSCFCYTFQVSAGPEHYAIYRTVGELMEFFKALNAVLYDNDFQAKLEGRPPAKCFVWVANLAHEWSFLKNYFAKQFDIKRCFAKSPRDVLYVDFGSFMLRECIGLFGHSLADIAKNWTATQKLKGDLDYDLVRTWETPLTDTERQYCINDVIILSEMHAAVLAAYMQDNGGVILPNTQGGFVRMKIKEEIRNDESITKKRESYNKWVKENRKCKTNLQYLCRKNKNLFVDEYQWSICRNYGFVGGLCGSNIDYAGHTQHNVQCVDLESDYPAQLLHKKFPAGGLKKAHKIMWDDLLDGTTKKPFFMLALVKKMDSASHHATFSKHKVLNLVNPEFEKAYGAPKNKIIYNGKIRRIENAVVLINDVDLRSYSYVYKTFNYTPISIYVFDRYEPIPPYLSKCIIDAYIAKTKLKREGKKDTVEYTDAKVIVNSMYGVLATRSAEMFDVFGEDGLFEPSKPWCYDDMTYNTWLNPYIAFWCTSYARQILMYFIGKFPDKIIQYDTDSLYYIREKSEALQAEIEKYNDMIRLHNEKLFHDNPNKDMLTNLGTWDFDSVYVNFLPMGAKKYIKQDTEHGIQTVIAGLPKYSIPAEIANEHIDKPFTYYNSLQKYIDTDYTLNTIIIKHYYSNKFASVFDDCDSDYFDEIEDYQGNTARQRMGSYHAIVPIDFTLAMHIDYLTEILRKDTLDDIQ